MKSIYVVTNSRGAMRIRTASLSMALQELERSPSGILERFDLAAIGIPCMPPVTWTSVKD